MPLIEMTSLVPLSLYPFIPLSRWSHEYPEETSNVKKSTVTKNKTKKRKHSEYPEETPLSLYPFIPLSLYPLIHIYILH